MSIQFVKLFFAGIRLIFTHPPGNRLETLKGKRSITADTALRFAAFFGMTSGFWLGLQADYDTEVAAQELSGVLAQIHRFEPLAA